MADSATKAQRDVTCANCGRIYPVQVPDPMPPRPAKDFFPVPQLQGSDLSRYASSSCPGCGRESLLDFGETGAVRNDGGPQPKRNLRRNPAGRVAFEA